jgi:competence protein ComEC
VDGDTVLLPAATKDEFRTAGLTHLTAVSGANLAYVAAAALVTARWAGLRGYAVQVAGLAALAAFVVVARPEPSVVRAAAMAVLTTLAALRGGRRAGGGSGVLAASVVLLLLVDPFLARSAGFALSALATGGLVLLAPGWRQRLARRLPSPVADAVAVSLAAQVATWPVLVLLTPQLSLVSVPANLLAAVAVPAATLLGVSAALTSLVLPAVGAVLAYLAALPAGWIVGVAHVCAGLPLAAVPWLPGVPGALALVGAMVLARTAAPAVFRRPPLLLGLAAGAALLVPGSPLRPTGWPPPDWVLVACDVGQGDALVVPVEAGTALVVDAGPDPRAVDRCLRDLGVSRVPLVVLTHFHADHVEGLPGVLDGRRVAEVEVSPLPDPPDEVRRVRGWAQAAGVPVVVAHAGEQRSDGSVSWTVLGPRRLVPGGSPPNNASVVLRVQTHGLVLLLTGDVEPEAQGLLLADPGSLRADVLKVPHHGSANQDPAFLRAVGASVALVSVGVGNPYGHPAPSTLAALAGLGMVVGRTDEDGDLAVVPVDGHPALVPRHPP